MDVTELPSHKKEVLLLPAKQVETLRKRCEANIKGFMTDYVLVDGQLEHGKKGAPVKPDWRTRSSATSRGDETQLHAADVVALISMNLTFPSPPRAPGTASSAGSCTCSSLSR